MLTILCDTLCIIFNSKKRHIYLFNVIVNILHDAVLRRLSFLGLGLPPRHLFGLFGLELHGLDDDTRR